MTTTFSISTLFNNEKRCFGKIGPNFGVLAIIKWNDY